MPYDDKVHSTPQSAPQLDELLRKVHGRDAGQRKAALEAMLQMGPAGIEALLLLLHAETRKRQNIKTMVSVFAWLLLALSALMLPGILLSVCFNAILQATLAAALVWFTTLFLFMLRSRLPLSARQKDMMIAAAEIKDVRAIGPLIDILGTPASHTSELGVGPLTHLLRQVQSSDSYLLDRRYRAILCGHLDHLGHSWNGADIAFVVAILHALEQVGDAEALPHVGQLAHRPPSPAPEVQAAAVRCMEVLRSRHVY